MKNIKRVFIALILIGLIVPLVTFNFKKNYKSEIDNRILTEFDLHTEGDKTDMIYNYAMDRIGCRSNLLNIYAEYNDKAYHKLVHPSYQYGKDGYIFFKLIQEDRDYEFMDEFCKYLKSIQDYCEARDVPFLYTLSPAIITVYNDELPDGYHYTEAFDKEFIKRLDKYGIHYVSNVDYLKEKAKKEQIYNVKYDARHWNDLGAYYGINNILSEIKKDFPDVRENTLDDFEVTERTAKYLPLSTFTINEKVPLFVDKHADEVEDITSQYADLKIDENHRHKQILKNNSTEAKTKNLPRVLSFQGSYINEQNRTKFLEHRFDTCYAIHNYENILNFKYYFNTFKPDYVLIESAEYSTNRDYFNIEKMKELNKKNTVG